MPECSKQKESWAQIRSGDVRVRWARQTFLPFSLCAIFVLGIIEINIDLKFTFALIDALLFVCFCICFVIQFYLYNKCTESTRKLAANCNWKVKFIRLAKIETNATTTMKTQPPLWFAFSAFIPPCAAYTNTRIRFFYSKTLLYQLEMIHSMVTKQKKLCIKPEAFMALAFALSPLIKIKQ